jgi:hypothetical protein
VSNELYVTSRTEARRAPVRRFGFWPGSTTVMEKMMDVAGLERALTSIDDVGAPDYGDEGMLQYLKTQTIIQPYQTRGYKMIELVRIYEAGSARRS